MAYAFRADQGLAWGDSGRAPRILVFPAPLAHCPRDREAAGWKSRARLNGGSARPGS